MKKLTFSQKRFLIDTEICDKRKYLKIRFEYSKNQNEIKISHEFFYDFITYD